MKISVLVCTRNRPQDIIWSLPSIMKSLYEAFEVIVVDQSDGEETASIVREIQPSYDNLIYIKTPTRGLSRSKNIGIAQASGEVIVCTDDDCEVGVDWIATIAEIFQEEPQIDMMFGQVHQPAEVPGGSSVPCLYFKERQTLSHGKLFGMGANMAFRRALVQKVGGYDVVLGPGSILPAAEEGDFCLRVQESGALVVADPRSCLIHRAYRGSTEWAKVMSAYGQGDAGCYLKHVRCGKPRSRRRFVMHVAVETRRALVELVRRIFRRGEPPFRSIYLKGFVHGLLTARKFQIDKEKCLYILPDQA